MLGMETHACHPSTRRWRQKAYELQTMGYMRTCLKIQNKVRRGGGRKPTTTTTKTHSLKQTRMVLDLAAHITKIGMIQRLAWLLHKEDKLVKCSIF